MNLRITLLTKSCLAFTIVFCCSFQVMSQNRGIGEERKITLTATDLTGSVSTAVQEALDRSFSDYKVISLDAGSLINHIAANRSNASSISLNIDDRHTYNIELAENDLRSSSYKLRMSSKFGGTVELPETSNKVYRGYVKEDPSSIVCATMNNEKFTFGIKSDVGLTFIEPLSSITGQAEAAAGQYVVYDAKNALTVENACGVEGPISAANLVKEHLSDYDQVASSVCKVTELAIAADKQMFELNYSDPGQLEYTILSILNVVDGIFYVPLEIDYVLTEIYISTQSNEISNDNDFTGSSIMGSFSTWAQTGFSSNFDVATLWTGKDFAVSYQSNIGLAWNGSSSAGVCGSVNKVHICEFWYAFSLGNAVNQAHEMGHNWSAGHVNGTTYIMNPSVGPPFQEWSSTSSSAITSFKNSKTCLGNCTGQKPEPDFSSDRKYGCGTLIVSFEDKTDFNPTSWSWNFGDGSTSTDQNPMHTYNTPGTYTVTLTASNSNGNDVATKTDYIEVGTGGSPEVQKLSVDLKSAGGYHGGSWAWMSFTAQQDVEIVSITVDAQDAGKRWFFLAQDKGGRARSILENKVVQLNAGMNKVTFNWKVPKGGKYHIGVDWSFPGQGYKNSLYRHNGGLISYPKNIGNLISIVGNHIGDWADSGGQPNPDWVKYFYIGLDWEVRPLCDIVSSTTEIAESREVKIYPNPSQGVFNISLPETTGTASLEIFNLIGESIYSRSISENAQNEVVDLEAYPKGTYILKLTDGKGAIITRKLIRL